MERFFPSAPGVDLSKLKITPEGEYSVTRPPEARQLLDFMIKLLHPRALSALSIVDGTANVGGETIHYARTFSHVHAVEINPQNFAVLQHNLQVYGIGPSKATLHNADSTKVVPKFRADVLVLDPPWGGPEYKSAPLGSLDLWMGPERVDAFVARVAPNFQWIFLKVPFNFAFERLRDLKVVRHAWRKRIRNYFVVGLQIKSTTV